MKTYFYLVVLSLFSLPLFAQELDTRPYLLIAGGISAAQESDKLSDNQGHAFSVGAGADFSKHLASEFRYVDLGTFDYKAASTQLNAKTLTASVLPYMQFDNSHLRLFGRVGAGYWTSENNLVSSQKKSGIDPVLGAGIEYTLGREYLSWAIRLDVTRHFQVGENNVTATADIDTVLLGFVFRQ